MFRKPGDEPKGKTSINCLIADGGMGDLLCSLPAIKHIHEGSPWVNLLVWCPDYMVDLFKNVLPDKMIIRGFSEAKKKYDHKKFGVTTQWAMKDIIRNTPMRTHPVIYSYAMLADYHPTIEEMSYLKVQPDKVDLKKFNLPEKYVVLPSAATERVKTIPKETLDELSKYVKDKGYTPVYLGRTSNPTGYEDQEYQAKALDYDFSYGINLMDQTTLLESAAIIAKSKCFIGIDGGLAHLAGFTDTPMVVYYSFVLPSKMMPVRDGIFGHNVYPIVPNLGCGGCQSKWIHMEHDFRQCYYDDFACVSKEECSAKKFIETIEKFNLL